MPYTELLKAKTPVEIEAIHIPAATWGQNNTNIYFTSYAPVPPFILKKILEYNSSTSQEIAVSCVKVLKAFEPTQAAISTLTDASATIAPEAQPIAARTHTMGGATAINGEQAREQIEAEGSDTAESNTITQEGPEGNRQDETQEIALLSSFGSHILYLLKVFP